MPQLEKDIESKMTRMVKRHGGKCVKWVCPGWDGVPDRMVLLPGGHVVFVETKRPKGGKRAALQKKWAEWLNELGFIHFWVKDDGDIEALEMYIVAHLASLRRK